MIGIFSGSGDIPPFLNTYLDPLRIYSRHSRLFLMSSTGDKNKMMISYIWTWVDDATVDSFVTFWSIEKILHRFTKQERLKLVVLFLIRLGMFLEKKAFN